MRFRSLVVSWCVCAIHGSMQIASGHRSLNETSRFTYHPSGEILFTHSPRNTPNLASSVLLLPMSRLRFPSKHTVDAISKAGVDKKTGHPRSIKLMPADREKIVESSAKCGSYYKRRKKCSCRKRDGLKEIESVLRGKVRKVLNRSSILRNLLMPAGATNVPASILNPTSESTSPQRFMDITTFTTTDAISSTAITTTETAKIATKEADDPTNETYRRKFPHKRCKKIKCMTRNCKRKRKRKTNVIDVLDQEFLRDNLGNVRTSETRSNLLENRTLDLQAIME